MFDFANDDAARLMVLALDLCGTFAFAVLGALASARDLLIGATPPAALTNVAYIAVSTAAGAFAFWFGAVIERALKSLQILDAAGLAFFAVAGAQKALAFGLDRIMAALLGMLTGIGGGIARDVLLAEAPSVLLPTEIFALAALAGAAIVALGAGLSWPAIPSAIAGGAACFIQRVAALQFRWRLPSATFQR